MNKPTAQQEAIFNEVANGNTSILIRARAGAGKTSTIVRAIDFIPKGKSVIFLAFNKNIADELRGRLASSIACKTMNALGDKAVKTYLRGAKLDPSRLYTLFGRLSSMKLDPKVLSTNRKTIIQLTKLGKAAGITPKLPGIKRVVIQDTPQAWKNIFFHHGLKCEAQDLDGVILAASKLLEISLTLSLNPTYDFDDQIALPVLYGWRLEQFDVAVIDEAQDTSDLKRELCLMVVKPGGRVIAVGDEKQTIYGFAGAAQNSMAQIALKTRAKEMKLSCTFRCAKKITDLAQTMVSDITCPESAAEGSVVYTNEAFDRKTMKDGEMVLSRFNAPLMELAVELFAAGTPFRFEGNTDLVDHALSSMKKLTSDGDCRGEELSYVARDHRLLQLIPLLEEGKPVESDIETFTFIETICERFSDLPVSEIIAKVRTVFENQSRAGVSLMTIHKSKGLEADKVYILNEHHIPSPFAKQDWEKEQERNLRYVAVTRAKKALEFIVLGEKSA